MAWIRREVGGARAIFSDKHGGVSRAPFATANCSGDSADLPGNVNENRRRVGVALGWPADDLKNWAPVRAEHGGRVAIVARDSGSVVTADAVMTQDRSVALAYRFADCGPLVLSAGGTVAAVHVGWRGVVAGIVENAVDALRVAEPGAPIAALLGPTIGPCCYLWPEQDLTQAERAAGRALRQRGAREARMDLPEAILHPLLERGVATEVVGICTACSLDHFSHRREGPGRGNQTMIATLA